MKIDKKALKIVLDLARHHVLVRYWDTVEESEPMRPTEEEAKALGAVAKIVGKEIDGQKEGTMVDVLEAMEKRNEN